MQLMTGVPVYVVTVKGRELGAFHTLTAAKHHAVTNRATRIEQWRGKTLIKVFHYSPSDGGWLIYELAQR